MFFPKALVAFAATSLLQASVDAASLIRSRADDPWVIVSPRIDIVITNTLVNNVQSWSFGFHGNGDASNTGCSYTGVLGATTDLSKYTACAYSLDHYFKFSSFNSIYDFTLDLQHWDKVAGPYASGSIASYSSYTFTEDAWTCTSYTYGDGLPGSHTTCTLPDITLPSYSN